MGILCIFWAAPAFLPTGIAVGADVRFQLVPRLTPGSANTAKPLPAIDPLQVSAGERFIIEVWGSDPGGSAGGAATGLTAAYLNILFTPGFATGLSATHSTLFPPFLGTEPVIDSAAGRVLNFGGATARLNVPQGIGPEWARIGWIDFEAADLPVPAHVAFAGSIGEGGIGCFGRPCGTVDIVGARVVILPEPSAGAFLAFAGIASSVFSWCRRARRPGRLGTTASTRGEVRRPLPVTEDSA